MTGTARDVHQPETFRSRLAQAMAIAWYALAVFSVYDLLSRGEGRAVPVGIAGVALVTVVVYAIAQRPAVVADARGVLLRNVVRDVWLPWHAVRSIGARWALSLETEDRSYSSWALTGGGAARPRRQRTPIQGSPLAPRTSLAHEISWTVPDRLEQLRRRGLHGERSGDVEVRTAWPVVIAFAVATAALVAAVVVPTS
jgi:hypothetical protein